MEFEQAKKAELYLDKINRLQKLSKQISVDGEKFFDFVFIDNDLKPLFIDAISVEIEHFKEKIQKI